MTNTSEPRAISTAAQLVLCCCPTTDSANRIARLLVEQRLAACVNIIPEMRSIYRWEENIEETKEAMLLIKTTATQYAAAESAIVSAHPYELPEVIAIDVTAGLPAYLQWLENSV